MKKLIIQIFTITTLIVVLNYIVITNQNKKQQEKVNDVIVNIVGTIKQEYPDLEDEKIIKILNDEEKIDAQVGFKRVKDILDYHISAKALRKMYLRILRK